MSEGRLVRGGEGGEDFDVARGGRCTGLLAPLGGELSFFQ